MVPKYEYGLITHNDWRNHTHYASNDGPDRREFVLLRHKTLQVQADTVNQPIHGIVTSAE